MNQIKIGEFLRELRKEKGLTQEQLAEQFNISRRSVSRWETGSNMPDVGLLIEIADFFDVDIREIIDGERKSENMDKEKETLKKVAEYADAEKVISLKGAKNALYLKDDVLYIYNINEGNLRYSGEISSVKEFFSQGEIVCYSAKELWHYLDKNGACDVIIVGRGGGSIEDLWAFNDEALARTIFEAKTPIISAVGHETDFTICDFVSDLRAPTPSAAAEIAVPDAREIMMRLDSYEQRSSAALSSSITRARMMLDKLSEQVSEKKFVEIISKQKEKLENIGTRLVGAIENAVLSKRTVLLVNVEKCNALSPLAVLNRGYSIAEVGGVSVNSVADLNVGDEMFVRMTDGRIKTRIAEIEEGKPI